MKTEITEKIKEWLREWLEGSKIEADEFNLIKIEGESSYKILIISLSGEPVKELAKKYGTDGQLKLRWIIPDFTNKSCIITDFQSGKKYKSGYIFRMKEFDEDNRGKIKPLHLCPNLDEGEISFAWYRDVKFKWKRFAKNIKEKCYIENFIRLEAGLNAIFTSYTARQAAKFTEVESENENHLFIIENERQVLTDWPTESLGRLRIPHSSHKNRLCPFQTPESNLTGLQLNLTADSEPVDGKIKEGNELFSIAVGLIPYPNHTDGPRLMMGGKNMKQAETGIAGAEAPIVPGYYEGLHSSDIKSLRNYMKNKRFFPYLGLNALTVIMPWEGYTYEDGLVISESLAKRFCINEGHYRYSKIFDVVINHCDIEKLNQLFNTQKNKKYIYGDLLEKPVIKFYDKKIIDKEIIWNEYYRHHAPGILDNTEVRHVIKKESGNIKEGTKIYYVEIKIIWNFIVKRPIVLGDKITGRNGNKGVITKIIPDEKMPQIHFSDGEKIAAELIISPCSILGRKNLGQILEMAHSLLIKKGGEKLKNLLEEKDIDLKNINLDDEEEIKKNLCEFLLETGCDKSGAFKITAEGMQDMRAFAGWQYFCRLHHHSLKKLQARGVNAPYDFYFGQPSRCGALTGQRMGEMENWSFLSHGAYSVLLNMRNNQTGNYEKTRILLKKVLRSLGISTDETNSELKFSFRNHDDDNLERKNLFTSLYSLENEPSAFCAVIKSKSEKSCKTLAEELRKKLPEMKKLDEIIKSEFFFNEDGSIHIEPEILLRNPQLIEFLRRFCMRGTDLDRAQALINYRDGLIKIISHKTGIPRCYMLGRRYNHSGRAVIVPEPSLAPDCVYIPAAMLIELFEGYDDVYIKRMPHELTEIKKLRRIFNDDDNNKAKKFADEFNNFLNSNSGELWCFLIRQPSLHRHSVQSFRIKCWEFPVIGLPPFVTVGFNADFDGDTMAVFLPPYEDAKNLSEFSIINNPGTVGNGKPAFAYSLDLALGYWRMNHEKLSSYMREFLKNKPSAEELRDFQMTLAKNSSGSATLSPFDFEFFSDNDEANNLNIMINSGAKGSMADIEKMVKSIGTIKKMKDENSEASEEKIIEGNFWHGLSNEELFIYSYSSRLSMAEKKLSVSDAGYLSRQLAEKLYELRVNNDDCGTDKGLEISYSDERLFINGKPLPKDFDIERILWGRVLLKENHCIKSEDTEKIFEALKKGEKIILRSPLCCNEILRSGNICRKCYGADLALKPYDIAEFVNEGFFAGLTAAQAIGERATQLPMQRFHNVGNNDENNSIKQIRELFLGDKKISLNEKIEAIIKLITNKELTQSLIHFEIAASDKLKNVKGKFLSDIAAERVKQFITKDFNNDTDNLSSIKSRLIWEGGKNGIKNQTKKQKCSKIGRKL